MFGDPFVYQNPGEVSVSHSPGRILCCAYTTFSNVQILIFGTTPSGLPHSVVFWLILFLYFLQFLAQFPVHHLPYSVVPVL